MTEVTAIPSQARFVKTKETALPHTCIACGRSADGKTDFIDFGVSIDYLGAVLLCSYCSKQIARTMGYIHPGERDLSVADKKVAEKELAEARKKIDELTSALATLRYVDTLGIGNTSSDEGPSKDEGSGDSVSEDSVSGKTNIFG